MGCLPPFSTGACGFHRISIQKSRSPCNAVGPLAHLLGIAHLTLHEALGDHSLPLLAAFTQLSYGKNHRENHRKNKKRWEQNRCFLNTGTKNICSWKRGGVFDVFFWGGNVCLYSGLKKQITFNLSPQEQVPVNDADGVYAGMTPPRKTERKGIGSWFQSPWKNVSVRGKRSTWSTSKSCWVCPTMGHTLTQTAIN